VALWRRRYFNLLALSLLTQGVFAPLAFAQERSLLVVGDSLSAEYGLPRGSGWVALLAQQLAQEKSSWRVINASISGDTTSGGRSRLPALLQQHQPGIVIIELGANDALRGFSMKMTEDNLQEMIKACQAMGAKVLLVGMQVPPNYGADYAAQFSQLFIRLSKTHKTAVVPFLLKGIADVPNAAEWFQTDRIHPNAAAHPRMLANVLPALKKLL
jgi:acyl-CoA thioesterase I